MFAPRRSFAPSLAGCLALFIALSAAAASPRERTLIDAHWRFAFGHPSDTARDFAHATGYFSYLAKTGFGDGPAAADFDDRAWRELDLPHDWAVEAPFSPAGSHSHGYKAAGKGFPERSVGWYRRRFTIAESDFGRRISLEFDGVFRASRVWVNGFFVGEHASGYSGFQYDVTDYLNYGGDNTIAVRVDASMEEGWFYEGAGITRHVWLLKTAPVHVKPWGTAITTELATDHQSAVVHIGTEVRHSGREETGIFLRHALVDPHGKTVGTSTLTPAPLQPGSETTLQTRLPVGAPALWSLHTPQRYTVVTTILDRDEVELDRTETPFGIRSIRWAPDEGFFLNEEHVKLKGINLHQDHAGVGAAVPDALYDFRLRRLKEFGVNAIRTGHRPPAPELLAACDRLGVLVVDENRLMGSSALHLDELSRMIRRDRNHPSVIIWSVGNEEWRIEGNEFGARITQTMQDFARRLDPSRRTTVAISGGWGGSSTTTDVVGYNYINQSDPDQQHADFPHQPGFGSEETSTQSTRGIFVTDAARGHLAPQVKGDTGGNNEVGWKFYSARPFLAGLFYWTGFDYRGEPTPFAWPAVSSQFGLFDLCGFPKDSTYYFKAWWTDEPTLHLAPHWNWPDRVGHTIEVTAYSNHETVELLLNGESLGRQNVPDQSKLTWEVPYAPGRLEARGFRNDAVVQTTVIETTGEPTRLDLAATRPPPGPHGRPVVIYSVSAHDESGRPVPTAQNEVSFEVTGGRIIGVGNGDPSSHEPDRFLVNDTLLLVDDWRGAIAAAGTDSPSDHPEQMPPMAPLGAWGATVPTGGQRYDLTGTFTLETQPEKATYDLFMPMVGRSARIWLNGREIATDLDTSSQGPALSLDRDHLQAGVNRIQMIVTPFDGPTRVPERNDLGTVRIRRPAATPQRRLFNGLAQVIVEAKSSETEVTLTATAESLKPAQLTSAAH